MLSTYYDKEPIEVLPWADFSEMFASSQKLGEHVSIVGPTGSGKTQLGLELCKIVGDRKVAAPGSNIKRPASVTVLCYKPRDDTMRKILPAKEWPEIKKWPPPLGKEHCIVWVRSGGTARQRAVFIPLLDAMYQEGNQTVYIPEASHFERRPPDGLGMGGKMTEFWSSSRSNKLTVISDTQRPKWVTRSMWTEPQWVMIFAVEDEDDLKEVARLSGQKMAVLSVMRHLGEHEFLCVRRQRGDGGKRALYISKVDS